MQKRHPNDEMARRVGLSVSKSVVSPFPAADVSGIVCEIIGYLLSPLPRAPHEALREK
jgi:hypothetical protein